jgi:hypothetical protein
VISKVQLYTQYFNSIGSTYMLYSIWLYLKEAVLSLDWAWDVAQVVHNAAGLFFRYIKVGSHRLGPPNYG